MKKVIRVKNEEDLKVLNDMLENGWDILGWTDMPFETAVAQTGNHPTIRIYGGWTDYILEISKEQRAFNDGVTLSTSRESN